MTFEEFIRHIDTICDDIDEVAKQLSPHKSGNKLKTNKPKDPIYAYVWRMARFNSGIDPRMPIVVVWQMKLEIEKVTKTTEPFGFISENERIILDKLDQLADDVLDEMNINKYKAAIELKGKYF